MNEKLIAALVQLHCSNCDGERHGCVGCVMREQITEIFIKYAKCDSNNLNVYYEINDGLGSIGYGYKCEDCGKDHRFVDEEDSEQECDCGYINILKVLK